MSPGARRSAAPAAILACAAICAGCREHLMATPNAYLGRPEDPFARVPEARRRNAVEVLYVTDRTRDRDSASGARYGRGRADGLVCGGATVVFGDASWDELVAASRGRRRPDPLPVKVTSLREAGGLEGDGEMLCAELSRRLAGGGRREVYVFVHGFNTTLEQGIQVIAQLWHFLGREGVPVAYSWPSWPAGQGGLRSYAWDYESAAYTVGHLKALLEAAAACDQVERVHLVAHSRGADVVLTALRELHLSRGGDAPQTRAALKLGAVVLAAADLDTGVMRERVIEEGLAAVPRCLVVYGSPDDWALDLSGWLLGDSRRLGRADAREMSGLSRANLQLIEAKVTGYSLNRHDYWYRHPAVSSDLLLVLAGRVEPGAPHGRPLEPVAPGVWRIGNDYLGP